MSTVDTDSPATDEHLLAAVAGMNAWAATYLKDIDNDAVTTIEYEAGDFIQAPDHKVYCKIDEGIVVLTSGEETIVELKAGDMLRSLPETSKFRLIASGELPVKTSWFDEMTLIERDDGQPSLHALERTFWVCVAEELAQASTPPQTTVNLFEPGDILVREGDQSTHVYEMIGGEAEVLVGGNIVGKILSGEFFGEYTFLVEERRSATVRALTHCTVQEISASEFEQLIQNRPRILLDIARDLAKRLNQTNQKVDNPKSAGRNQNQTSGRYRIRLRT